MTSCCLGCQYFRVEEVYQHIRIDKIRNTKKFHGGQCTFYPEWIEVREDHYCGQFASHGDAPSIQTIVWGSWREQDYDRMKNMNTKLYKQLERSRARVKKLSEKVSST